MQVYYIANAIVSGLRTTALSRNSLSSSHPPPITLIIPIAPVIPIAPITPIILIIPIILIAPITPIKIFAVLYCGMIAFWVFEGRFRQKNREKKCEKIWLLTKKGVPLHSLFGDNADGTRAGAPKRLKSVKLRQ